MKESLRAAGGSADYLRMLGVPRRKETLESWTLPTTRESDEKMDVSCCCVSSLIDSLMFNVISPIFLFVPSFAL